MPIENRKQISKDMNLRKLVNKIIDNLKVINFIMNRLEIRKNNKFLMMKMLTVATIPM